MGEQRVLSGLGVGCLAIAGLAALGCAAVFVLGMLALWQLPPNVRPDEPVCAHGDLKLIALAPPNPGSPSRSIGPIPQPPDAAPVADLFWVHRLLPAGLLRDSPPLTTATPPAPQRPQAVQQMNSRDSEVCKGARGGPTAARAFGSFEGDPVVLVVNYGDAHRYRRAERQLLPTAQIDGTSVLLYNGGRGLLVFVDRRRYDDPAYEGIWQQTSLSWAEAPDWKPHLLLQSSPTVACFSLSGRTPDARRVYLKTWDHLRIWEIDSATKAVREVVLSTPLPARCLIPSPTGSYLATAAARPPNDRGHHTELQLVDLRTGQVSDLTWRQRGD